MQDENEKFFGTYLIAHIGLDPECVRIALERQRSSQPRLGEIAVQRQWLSRHELEMILARQTEHYRLFGQIAIELGLLERAQIEQLLEQQAERRERIGDILVAMGALTESEKRDCLRAYRNWLEAAAAFGRSIHAPNGPHL